LTASSATAEAGDIAGASGARAGFRRRDRAGMKRFAPAAVGERSYRTPP
jgi:hypothetical protein